MSSSLQRLMHRRRELSAQLTLETGTPVSMIGEIVPEAWASSWFCRDERIVTLEAHGWDHFKEDR